MSAAGGEVKALALAIAILPSAALAADLTSDQLAQGASMIRVRGYACEQITRIARRGNAYRVNCGRVAYRVTVKPLTLRPW